MIVCIHSQISVKEEKSATGPFLCEGMCSIILYSNENETLKGLDESHMLAKVAYFPHAVQGCGLHSFSRRQKKQLIHYFYVC